MGSEFGVFFLASGEVRWVGEKIRRRNGQAEIKDFYPDSPKLRWRAKLIFKYQLH